jgi:hypothetical protein
MVRLTVALTEEPKAEMPPFDQQGRLLCSYCGAVAHHHRSSEFLYNGRDYGPVWHCQPCAAWVGCHPGKDKPLGRLARADLRRSKQQAHQAFDRLWRDRSECGSRSAAYAWLATQLGIDRSTCHIGMMNVSMCRKVVEICQNEFADVEGVA